MNLDSGIYIIENISNKKKYVGNSCVLEQRFRQHRHLLRNDKHNDKLQNAWNKYGEDSFRFYVIEYVEGRENLIAREQYWINFLDVYKTSYNMAPIAGSTKGMSGLKHSQETKDKMSLNMIGNKRGAGAVFPQERKDKISNALKGNTNGKDVKGMLGKKHSEETRAKMRTAQLIRRFDEANLKLGELK